MPVSSSTEHWIKPDALKINLNHFGDPDYLQVSVLAGAVVMAFKQDVIDYNAAHNYRTWPLDAANTYLETPSAYHVYARLTRSEVNARALVIYDPVLRDIEGREITYVTDEETGKETEELGEPSEDHYYIFLGKISSSVSETGSSVLREWESEYRSGTLQTNQQQNDLFGMLGKMFRPHYDDPLDPDKLTWIEALTHLGVAGGVTSFIDNGDFDLPGIYDGLPIDNQTLYWEETEVEVTDENGNAVTKVIKILKSKGSGEGSFGSFTLEGTGNAITGVFEREENDKKVLVFNKGLTFVEKSYIDDTFYTKEYINDELKKYVPIEGDCEIKGTKNFTGALQVNGQPIVYDADGGYWKLDGDLLVTGGITSFADDTEFTPSTIMDGVVVDGVTIQKNSYGQLEVIGGTGGGTADSVAWNDVTGKPSWIGSSKPSYSYSEISGTPDLSQYATQSWVNEQGFLTSSGLPTATTSVKGMASFNSDDFTVSSGKVSLNARVKIVSSLPSSRTTNTLYVIV